MSEDFKFHYGDQVRIKAGFYKGSIGSVSGVTSEELRNYKVLIDPNTCVVINPKLLEPVAPPLPENASIPIIGEEMPSDEQMLMWSTDAYDEMDEKIEQGQGPEVTP